MQVTASGMMGAQPLRACSKPSSLAAQTASPRLYRASNGVCTNTLLNDSYMSITMGGQSSASLQFCVRDSNTNADAYGGNPLLSGVKMTSTANIANARVTIADSSIPDGVNGPSLHTLTVHNTSTASPKMHWRTASPQSPLSCRTRAPSP